MALQMSVEKCRLLNQVWPPPSLRELVCSWIVWLSPLINPVLPNLGCLCMDIQSYKLSDVGHGRTEL